MPPEAIFPLDRVVVHEQVIHQPGPPANIQPACLAEKLPPELPPDLQGHPCLFDIGLQAQDIPTDGDF